MSGARGRRCIGRERTLNAMASIYSRSRTALPRIVRRWASGSAAAHPPISRRAAGADPAVIDRVLAEHMRPGVTNLAVGLAHWSPPAGLDANPTPIDSRYGDCQGDPALLDVLRSKLAGENSIAMEGRELMVTPGANQAFVHALLAVCDSGDQVALFAPYYMAHYLAIQVCADPAAP